VRQLVQPGTTLRIPVARGGKPLRDNHHQDQFVPSVSTGAIGALSAQTRRFSRGGLLIATAAAGCTRMLASITDAWNKPLCSGCISFVLALDLEPRLDSVVWDGCDGAAAIRGPGKRSMGLVTPSPPRCSTWVYIIVVVTSAWPSRSYTVRMS
jgi:hypothetical protein